MFSPTVNAGAPAPVRSSRRRPRPHSNENSLAQPKSKRVRSSYDDQTFAPNGTPEMDDAKSNKFRGKKSKGGDRAGKGDGSVVLTKNDTYTVSKLPALPDQIRAEITARQHGAIYSDSGYALALTHSHAFVWPYAINIPSPETFTFALPHITKHGSEPLPLGSAATLDLIKLKSNGVGSTISGMLSGETVVQLLNAETAGFVLAFSTGRLAYLRVRDGHGRPEISVQFLRGSSGLLAGGIFGSLRNVLSSSAWRGDIAAVRAGPQEHNALHAEAEGREAIVLEIKKAEPTLFDVSLETFEVIDFAFTPQSLENQENEGDHLLLLTSLSNRHTTHYTLVDVVLKREQLIVENVRLIRSYTTPVNKHAISKVRIYLPNPALVAYIIFDRAVVVVSRVKQAESPDSQLRSEDHTLTPSFEDVVDFRDDTNVEIVGSGMEEPQNISHGIEEAKSRKYKAKHPAAVLLVRGQQVTAKSKLEQAVFFGTMAQNPLSFSGRPELQFPAEEIGEAALELSLEIVQSKTPFIPSVSASLEQHLKRRAAALQDLAKHLKATGVALDRVTRWKLLWNAEKMTAATIIWQRYDSRIRELPEGQRRGLLAELVDHIHEDFKTEAVPEKGRSRSQNSPDPEILDKVRLEHSTLIDMAIRSNTERIRWVSAQDSPQLQMQAEGIQSLQVIAQDTQLKRLASEWELPDEAMRLAEKHEILQTLASVLMFEMNSNISGSDSKKLNDRMDKYFANFGASWATALYEYYISHGELQQMLNDYQNQGAFLTAFLRDKPEYAKIGWIHEITREKDYDEAARMLLELGLDRERDVWSKKVELSIGKLSRLAGRNYSQKNGILIPDGGEAELTHIYPSINTAIDDNAEVQLALETHGNKDLKRQFSFMNLLENSMTHLVKHEAMDAFLFG
ncbi:hypothetical protein DID88_001908 [Monilinia fructigena]|uniref:Nucleoporin Nup133/Nup155-like C-terminal domain-containing protein n=1 Tax=Monilinia fructigena TaxID=38457 RepID=A0A395IW02_9HELO|nr:hypothetical protein DID88_001908 [Monilinia fructigena]